LQKTSARSFRNASPRSNLPLQRQSYWSNNMASLIGITLCASVYAWYLGMELADAKTRIEYWIEQSTRG